MAGDGDAGSTTPRVKAPGAIFVVPLLVLLVHAVMHARVQGISCIDDAYISFQYARNLVEGHGLVFNPGERVEGYTNFGWVMLLSVVHALGADLEASSRVLAFLCGAGLVSWVTAWFVRRGGAVVGGLVGLALALDGTIARWSQDGLETMFFAMIVAMAITTRIDELDRDRTGVASSLLFALCALTRPEGFVLFGLSWLAGLFAGGAVRDRVKRAVIEGLCFTGPTAIHVGWRLAYYGMPLPNTFYAKVGASGAQVERGLAYTGQFWLLDRAPLVLGAIATLVATARAKWRLADAWVLAVVGVWLVYVTAVGGDWMGPGRFYAPILGVLLIGLGRRGLAAREHGVGPGVGRPKVVLGAVLIAALLSGATSHLSERAILEVERPLLDSRRELALFLADAAEPDARLLTGEIGALAWFSRLYTLDLYGLIDPEIARMDVETLGEGLPGHEKADLGYSLAQEPTLIVIPGLMQAIMAGRPDPRLADFEVRDTRIAAPIAVFRYVLVRRAAPSSTE